jgi:ribosomal protein S25
MSKAAPLGLSSKAASRIRRITVITVALLALSAAILSFSGLLKLALDAGFPIELAWLFPIMIDGMIVVGSLGVIASALVGVSTWYMWLLTLLGVAASVVGNIAAAPADLLSQTVHAAPPLVFALSVEGLLRVYRTQAAALIAGEGFDVQPVAEQLNTIEANNNVVETQAQNLTTQTTTSTAHNKTSGGVIAEKVTETKPKSNTANPDTPSSSDKTVKEKIAEVLAVEPDITGSAVARRLNVDPSYARKTIKILKAEMGINSSAGVPVEKEISTSTESLVFEEIIEEEPLIESFGQTSLVREFNVDTRYEENKIIDEGDSNSNRF